MANYIEPYYLNRYCAECGSMLNVEPVFVSDTEHNWKVICPECDSAFLIDGKYRIYSYVSASEIESYKNVPRKQRKRKK